MNENEEVEQLIRLIKEDNVKEVSNFLNSHDYFRDNFNIIQEMNFLSTPVLHIAVHEKSQKVVGYLLSQDFVYKSICNSNGENIYHVICSIRGEEELFSIIEKKVPHEILLDNSNNKVNAFHIACEVNNIFIVKKVYEILASLKVDLTQIKLNVMNYALNTDDIDVIKYILSIDGIYLNNRLLFVAIKSSKFDIVVYVLNNYLWKSVPSHLHNQFHIFMFLLNNPFNNIINKILKNHNNYINNNKSNNYLVEEKIKEIELSFGYEFWHAACQNANLDVVQLIFSLKGIRDQILVDDGYNPFLRVCEFNSNIKVIKYIHKLFPSFINSQINTYGGIQNGAFLILENPNLHISDKLKIFHYLNLNGIDFHLISIIFAEDNQLICRSIYFRNKELNCYKEDDIGKYLKLISHDFDYLHNEHDDKEYRKPSFWKEIDNNADEHSKRVNLWKNRFEELVLVKLSKMIQETMLPSWTDNSTDDDESGDDESDDEESDDDLDSDDDNDGDNVNSDASDN